MQRRWILSATLAASLPLIALTLSARAADAPPKPAEATEIPPPAPAETKPIEVELIEAGKEPRRPLRLGPQKGQKVSTLMVVAVETTTEMPGFPLPAQKLPVQEFTFDYEVTDVAANGDIAYTFKVRKAELKNTEEVMPVIVESMRSAVGAMEGISGSAVVSSRGVPRKTDLKLPDNAPPQAKQMLTNMRDVFSQFSAPFPEEAVGEGAKWKAVHEGDVGGMKAKQTTHYEIASLEKDAVRLKVSLEQSAGEQELGGTQALGAMKPKLLSMKGTGQGETVIGFGEIAPRKSTLEALSETKLSMTLQGQEQTMTTKGRVQVELGPAPSE